MRRPLIWITVGYIIGIIWGLYLKISIAPIFFIFGGISIFLIKARIIDLNLIKEYKFFIITFFIFLIISNIQINFLENKHRSLYQQIKDSKTEEIEVTGTVISDRKETTYKASYTLQVNDINKDTKYRKTNLIIYTKKDIYLKYGNQIHFKGTYEEASTATNYKAFDYREYLKAKNVYGIVEVSNEIDLLKDKNLNLLLIIINKIREKIKSNLKEILGERSKLATGILLRRYL